MCSPKCPASFIATHYRVSSCSHVSVICEEKLPPLFWTYEAPVVVRESEGSFVSESPLSCSEDAMKFLTNDAKCSDNTYEIVCHVRNLTELFLDYKAEVQKMHFADHHAAQLHSWSSLSAKYNAEVDKIQNALQQLPSARTPGLIVSNDWIYETCRLAAAIQASAMIMCVPLSVAADPIHNVVLGQMTAGRPVTEQLDEAMKRTDLSELWGNMSGVLYWACLIGVAASRTAGGITASESGANVTWSQRCLNMTASRCCGLLQFEHPVPVLSGLRRLLAVQEELAAGHGQTAGNGEESGLMASGAQNVETSSRHF